MDKKVPKSYQDNKFTLCIIAKVTYYLITVPIYQSRPEEIGDVLTDNVI